MPKTATKSKKARAKAAPKKPAKLAPVPPHMAWVSVYLAVEDPAASLDFYEKAFGFKRGLVMPGKDGKIMHAELHYKDNTIMLGPACAEMNWKSPAAAGIGATTAAYYVYCEDVDALFARAVQAGAKPVREPKDQFYGDRTCCVTDPDGHTWSFGQRLKEFDPATCSPDACSG